MGSADLLQNGKKKKVSADNLFPFLTSTTRIACETRGKPAHFLFSPPSS